MQQIGFPQANRILGPPKGMTEEECGTLELYQDEKQCISCWILSDEEIEKLKQTRRIWLGVMGGQPPVWLMVDNPFRERETNGNE